MEKSLALQAEPEVLVARWPKHSWLKVPRLLSMAVMPQKVQSLSLKWAVGQTLPSMQAIRPSSQWLKA